MMLTCGLFVFSFDFFFYWIIWTHERVAPPYNNVQEEACGPFAKCLNTVRFL